MELSPEEKRKIYEEEKARIEAREQIEREKRLSTTSSTGLQPNVAGLLCYVGWWISGIVFFVLEQKNAWVRFHAAQSIVVFGTITVAGVLLSWIPVVGPTFGTIISIIGFILWLVLMLKAYNGERYKLAWAGDIAEKIVDSTGMPSGDYAKAPEPAPAKAPETPAAPPPPVAAAPPAERVGRRIEHYIHGRREGRIAESAFAIAWSLALLIFFNFFNRYVAYYHADVAGNTTNWSMTPLFTTAVSLWLPVLTLTLVISIAGHIALIIYDKYILRELIRIVIDVFGLITVVTLLTIFPFNFSVIPDVTIARSVPVGVTVVLAVIAFGIGLGILVRAVKLIVNLARGITGYQDAG